MTNENKLQLLITTAFEEQLEVKIKAQGAQAVMNVFCRKQGAKTISSGPVVLPASAWRALLNSVRQARLAELPEVQPLFAERVYFDGAVFQISVTADADTCRRVRENSAEARFVHLVQTLLNASEPALNKAAEYGCRVSWPSLDVHEAALGADWK